jgi:hypothetical protein
MENIKNLPIWLTWRIRSVNPAWSCHLFLAAPTVNGSSVDDMFKVATVVQQIMTELNGAVSEEDKIVAITKIVLNLMKQNGH